MLTGPGAEDPVTPTYVTELKEKVLTSHDWRREFLRHVQRPNRNLYEALWRVELMSGSPKIRLLDESLIPKSARRFLMGSDHRAFYDHSTNTMYIDFFSMRDFIAEASHGKQFAEDPLGSYLQGLRDVAHTAAIMVATGKGHVEAHSMLYEIPGTVEHSAHRIVEPPLRDQVFKRDKPASDTPKGEAMVSADPIQGPVDGA
jgi:hypothetical protein